MSKNESPREKAREGDGCRMQREKEAVAWGPDDDAQVEYWVNSERVKKRLSQEDGDRVFFAKINPTVARVAATKHSQPTVRTRSRQNFVFLKPIRLKVPSLETLFSLNVLRKKT